MSILRNGHVALSNLRVKGPQNVRSEVQITKMIKHYNSGRLVGSESNDEQWDVNI